MSTGRKVELVASVRDEYELNPALAAVDLPKSTWRVAYHQNKKVPYEEKYAHLRPVLEEIAREHPSSLCVPARGTATGGRLRNCARPMDMTSTTTCCAPGSVRAYSGCTNCGTCACCAARSHRSRVLSVVRSLKPVSRLTWWPNWRKSNPLRSAILISRNCALPMGTARRI